VEPGTGWIVAIGGAIATVIAALVAGMQKRAAAQLAKEKQELEAKLRVQLQEANLSEGRESIVVRQLRQIIKDKDAERRADDLACEQRIASYESALRAAHLENQDLRKSERALFARVAQQDQLIEILKERDTKMRHGLADQGIGVRSVEGKLVDNKGPTNAGGNEK
jgi:hypothetical protein